jgi:Cu(I)/Ag(I) efflux system membrane fusion protein
MRLTRVGWSSPEVDAVSATLNEDSVAVAGVRSAPSTIAPVRRKLRVSGSIEDNPESRYRVTAATAGRVEALKVRQTGVFVHAESPLLEIYSPMLLTAARRQIALRRLALRPAPEGTPTLTLEQQRMLDGGDQQLRLMGLTQAQCDALAQGPENPTRMALLAPVAGTVVAIHVQAGSSFRDGDPLFDLADLSSLSFIFDVWEEDLALLSDRSAIRVRAPSFPGVDFRSRINGLPVEVHPVTRQARLRVPLDVEQGAKTALRQRLSVNRAFAFGEIELATEPVLTVPRSAVLATGDAPVVYVEASSPGRYVARTVSLGRAGDREWEVIAGLGVGERVVTSGAMLVDAQRQMQAYTSSKADDRLP